MLQVLEPQPEGPRITPFLSYQLERAWAFDAARQERFARVKTEADLLALQDELRRKALAVIGGLPDEKTPLNVRVTGTIPMDGYRIEKIVFESLPGIHVTALVYVPDAPAGRKPAVLVACGHSPVGKAYADYQEIAVRLARRGYVVLCWDPVGQGERSQFWDEARGRSRYNLVCGEHAVLGNFATIAGTSLVRYMVWDGMRAVDVPARRATTWTRAASRSRARAAAASRRSGSAPSTRASPRSCPRASRPRCPCAWPTASSRTPTATPSRTPRARLRGDRPPGTPPPRVPPPAPRLRGRPRLLPDRGHAQDDARGRGLLPRASATATASRSARATTSTSTRRRTRRGRSRSWTAPSAGRSTRLSASEDARARGPAVHAERPGARGPRRAVAARGDPRRRRGRRPAARIDRRALPRPRLPGRPRLAGRAVRGVGAPRRDRVGGGRARTASGRAIVDRYRLHHGGGLVIPLVHVRREGGPRGNVLLRLGLEGKVRPADWTEVEARLADGHEVVSFDPRGLGETRMRYRAASIDDPDLAPKDEDAAYASPLSGVLANHVYNAQLLGRPYLLDVIEDVEIAARFARARLGAREVAIDAPGDARLLGRAVAAALPGRRARAARRRPSRPSPGRRRSSRSARPGRSTTSCPAARRCASIPGPATRERRRQPDSGGGRAARVLLSAAALWGGTGLEPAWWLTWLAPWSRARLRAARPGSGGAGRGLRRLGRRRPEPLARTTGRSIGVPAARRARGHDRSRDRVRGRGRPDAGAGAREAVPSLATLALPAGWTAFEHARVARLAARHVRQPRVHADGLPARRPGRGGPGHLRHHVPADARAERAGAWSPCPPPRKDRSRIAWTTGAAVALALAYGGWRLARDGPGARPA